MAARPATRSTHPAASELFVHWVNAVILAEFHNPSILNRDFLASKRIVPQSWKVVESLSTPAVATIVYDNGLRFVVDQNRLEIRREINDQLQTSYDIFDRAIRYISLLPHVPYKSLGINWNCTWPCPNPATWLLTRFYRQHLSKSNYPKILGCAVQLQYLGPDSICNIRLDPGKLQQHERQLDAITINVNFHHDDTTKPRQLSNALNKWPEKQEFMVELVSTLLHGAVS